MHFDESSDVHHALRRIAMKLDELGIAYALSDGMAMFQHGYRRFTQDVDLLVTRDDLRRIHEALSGRGYLPVFEGSKNLRDAETGVRIEFLITGDFPGDGKPKPVAFPHPADAAVEIAGVKVLGLEALIELKLASGMTQPDRRRDLVDVQEMIRLFELGRDDAMKLDPSVRETYHTLWDELRAVKKRYLALWPRQRLTTDADLLQTMRGDGVWIDNADPSSDRVRLITDDPNVAAKYDMHDEADFMGE